ncbi:uncharacterized protein SCDLUD_001216 [Saccharomycodes ludwigii]|uniref:uncharacterized protein n=1 Tax=Saccharomycodes ludwigii TaxID=36035 RepID=UPI001E848E24|nr:hypothetical protein SCDLUD_001216 [Saccharomycodes ludwigii]KAH3903574.1 hypothetical protein SCDLUD_001216 [Saccharomycodes ludwigii]
MATNLQQVKKLNNPGHTRPSLTDKEEFENRSLTNLTFYATALNKKHKYRYNAKLKKTRSLLNDVVFDIKDSLLDKYLYGSLKAKFKGPSLESRDKANPAIKGLIEEKQNQQNQVNKNKEKNNTDKSATTADNYDYSIEIKKQVVTTTTMITEPFTDFSGFFIFTWMTCFLIVFKQFWDFYQINGFDLSKSQVWTFMSRKWLQVALIDLLMYLSIYFAFLVQILCLKKVFTWHKVGRWLIYIYEVLFIVLYIYVAEGIMKFHWISRIFLFLHSCVLLMKMHSYSFYNSYLWGIYNELHYSKRLLKDISESVKERDVSPEIIESLNNSIEFCTAELNSQSDKKDGNNVFPKNINFKNFFMFTMYPTLVYQISYPRTNKIRWYYVFEKICAIIGIIILMMVFAQMSIYPHVIEAEHVMEAPAGIQRFLRWMNVFVDMMPGFIAESMLTWYLIWDAILNCIAELTCFADRSFYGDWWNCITWDEYARLWNLPVHKFLLRHVYHSTISSFHLNKKTAILMTFLLSSIVHEIAMYVLFNKVRFYLFILQMSQMPQTFLFRRYLNDHKILGNAIFWFGVCITPGLICSIYISF